VYKGGHNIETEEQICGGDDEGKNKAGINQSEDGNTACPAGVKLVIVGEPTVNEGGGKEGSHRQNEGEGNREEIDHKAEDLPGAHAEFLDRAQNTPQAHHQRQSYSCEDKNLNDLAKDISVKRENHFRFQIFEL
jgi:hypothetical protein